MNKYGIFLAFLVEPKALKTILYGFSVLSGPVLALGIASIWCLIPYHNVLEEPCYWYEYQLTSLLNVPILIWTIHPLGTEYWAKFSIKKSKNFFIFLCFVACATRISAITIYNLNWTDFVHPIPLNGQIYVTITFTLTTITALVRYVSSFHCTE